MAHWVKIIQAPLKVTYHGENTEAAIANLLGKLVFFFLNQWLFFSLLVELDGLLSFFNQIAYVTCSYIGDTVFEEGGLKGQVQVSDLVPCFSHIKGVTWSMAAYIIPPPYCCIAFIFIKHIFSYIQAEPRHTFTGITPSKLLHAPYSTAAEGLCGAAPVIPSSLIPV